MSSGEDFRANVPIKRAASDGVTVPKLSRMVVTEWAGGTVVTNVVPIEDFQQFLFGSLQVYQGKTYQKW
jgi:hypothetical protein